MKSDSLLVLGLAGAWALAGLARPTQTRRPSPVAFVRPYREPRESAILADRVRHLEQARGDIRYDFEYSLPARDKLLVKVVLRKKGVLDREASGLFVVTGLASAARNAGRLTLTRHLPRPQEASQRNTWYVDLGGQYGYGFHEGTPEHHLGGGALQQNYLIGGLLRKEHTAFAYRENGNIFSLVVQAQALPMTARDKPNNVTRFPLK